LACIAYRLGATNLLAGYLGAFRISILVQAVLFISDLSLIQLQLSNHIKSFYFEQHAPWKQQTERRTRRQLIETGHTLRQSENTGVLYNTLITNSSEHILVNFHCWDKVIPFQGLQFFLNFLATFLVVIGSALNFLAKNAIFDIFLFKKRIRWQ